MNQPHRSVYTQDNSTLEACECIHEKKINPCTVGVCLDGKNKEPRVDCAAKQQVERVIDDFAARFTFFFGGRGEILEPTHLIQMNAGIDYLLG